jgi:hypothetical protein
VASETSQADWTGWNETYEPDAGIVNFVRLFPLPFLLVQSQLDFFALPQYQLKDSLTAHVDQAEADAVRPLVSFRCVSSSSSSDLC